MVCAGSLLSFSPQGRFTKNIKARWRGCPTMEKNLIKEQLKKIEELLSKANSPEEYLFLLGMKEALVPFRFIIELKGGTV